MDSLRELKEELADIFARCANAREKIELMDKITEEVFKMSECPHPIGRIKWVPIEKVEANDYNPNSVAAVEMRLLYISIKHDGYTQPVVTIYDEVKDMYVIVDGFHRFTTMRMNKDIRDKTGGLLPIVVIEKDINDRMASTVRHNRARGKHSIAGMANMVFEMLEKGWDDERICAELGMSADELVRLKHVTGFSKLFENVEYRKAWENNKQLALKRDYKEKHPTEKLHV
jgi:ParB-like chromosome segregation protein Spo0J